MIEYFILAFLAVIPVFLALLDAAHDRSVKKQELKDWWKAQYHLSSKRILKEKSTL